MAKIYSLVNGAAAGAAAPVKVTTGTAIKTLIQLASASTIAFRIKQWWIEFDGSTAATPIEVELLRHTGAPDTTMTAYVAGDIAKVSDPNAVATNLQLGAALSGYTATAEVTPTGVGGIESHLVPPTGGLLIQYPLGQEPEVAVSQFLRIRVTASAAVNAYCGVVFEE
jgi:hypothetical protein